jgi:two-component SAPR family response regulator
VSRQVPGLIVNDGAILSLHDRVDVDLHRVRARIRELRNGWPLGTGVDVVAELRDAELLPGWYDDWVLFEQNRLLQDRLRAFIVISRTSLSAGDSETAAEAAEAALDIEPLFEGAISVLIAAEMQRGNPAAALRSYERYREQLQREMGVLPSDAIRGLVAGALERQARRGKETLLPTSA